MEPLLDEGLEKLKKEIDQLLGEERETRKLRQAKEAEIRRILCVQESNL